MKGMLRIILPLFLLISCSTPSERSENPFLNTENDPVLIGPEEERAIGLQAAAEIARQYRVSKDPVLRGRVASLGARLAALGRKQGIRYQFAVLESPEVNAFALPGGYIYLSTGILKHLEEDAELAAVLGHEIGHVERSHGIKQLQRQVAAAQGMEWLLSLLSKDKAAFVAAFAGPAAKLLFLRNSREAELEADEAGMLLAGAAGFDPAAMIAVQEMLLKAGGRGDPLFGDFLSTHPASQARIEQARRLLHKTP